MFVKTECDFKALSFSDWVFHHYMSGDALKEEVQLRIAMNAHDSSVVSDCDTWEAIEQEMDNLPWVVHPEKLSISEFEKHPMDTWVSHFFTSGQQDIELEWQMIAEMRMASDGGSFECWQKILKECNHAEDKWKHRLQARRQGGSAAHRSSHSA